LVVDAVGFPHSAPPVEAPTDRYSFGVITPEGRGVPAARPARVRLGGLGDLPAKLVAAIGLRAVSGLSGMDLLHSATSGSAARFAVDGLLLAGSGAVSTTMLGGLKGQVPSAARRLTRLQFTPLFLGFGAGAALGELGTASGLDYGVMAASALQAAYDAALVTVEQRRAVDLLGQ